MLTQRPQNKNLLEKIQKIDFALYETVLYLDAYPENSKALAYYHKLKAMREKLVAEYQACTPMTNMGNTSETSWDWIKSPWPWHYTAN